MGAGVQNPGIYNSTPPTLTDKQQIQLQVDTAGNLKVVGSGTSGVLTVNHATTGFGDGVKVVAAAGTDEALAASTAAKWVTIQAQTDNTSRVSIGATGVDATIATGDGISLAPGDVVTIPCDNLADIFVDALVSGEGVRYVYGT
jgi:hypothetical protein